jgi:NAD(P)-dependent dehydrogenase (short-subunit alcohol dehydrogenase family)
MTGQKCVVTGATSGIGRSLALELVARGATVWALGRNGERLAALEVEAHELPGRLIAVLVDLESRDDTQAAAATVTAAAPSVDLLVHSAGAIALGAFGAFSVDDFDRMYRVNVFAPALLTHELLEPLRRAQGQVVFINSSAGVRASAENVLYAATKHGLKALADGLREQVNRDGVRVISVYVGRTDTPMQRLVHEHEQREYRPDMLLRTADVVDVVLGAVDVPRSGEVTDVSIRPAAKL